MNSPVINSGLTVQQFPFGACETNWNLAAILPGQICQEHLLGLPVLEIVVDKETGPGNECTKRLLERGMLLRRGLL